MPNAKIVILARPIYWEGEAVARSWRYCYIAPNEKPVELGRVSALSTEDAARKALELQELNQMAGNTLASTQEPHA